MSVALSRRWRMVAVVTTAAVSLIGTTILTAPAGATQKAVSAKPAQTQPTYTWPEAHHDPSLTG